MSWGWIIFFIALVAYLVWDDVKFQNEVHKSGGQLPTDGGKPWDMDA